MAIDKKIQLLFDGECPVCNYYSKKIDIEDGELIYVNARESSDLRNEVVAAGHDLDTGMVLKVGETIHHGSDALHVLALLSSREGLFNRFTAWLFRHPRLARALYPVLVACRNLLLRILGKQRIDASSR